MSDHPLEQLDPQVLGSNSPNSTVRIKKRNLLRDFLGIPKSNSKDAYLMTSNQLTRLSSIVPQVASDPPGDNHSTVSPPVILETKLQSLPQSLPPNKAQEVMDIFPDNLPKPVIKTALPRLQERIESTQQLVYCISLLLQDSLSPAGISGDDVAIDATFCLQESALNRVELDWLEEIKKNPMEQDHLHWLLTRMVEVFTADTTKDSVELAEMVALGPVLQKEPYRKLVSSLIKEFEDGRILDVNLLQGLVELVQSASSDHLVSDDLVRILSILRIRLQDTRQKSTELSYRLTLAVSMILDVMADHKLQDLDRVLQQEPLSGVLSGLRGSSDPYVMYQACYAFQALQYVPEDESALQAVLRHSIGMADGLVKVSAVFKLDLVSVLKGLSSLQELVDGIVGDTTMVYEGVSSLMESGQGVFDSLKGGLSTGQRRPWYPAIKAAYAFAQAGQLNDLRQLIFGAPCRHDPLFQWGICQLLGEIAVNPVWAVATCEQAINLLGHLINVDRDWGRDDNVRAWMLTIVAKLGDSSDHAANTVAHALLQDIDQNKSASIHNTYPLTTRLPIPASSPVLTKVHSIPSVEYDLHKLHLQRLKETHLPVYIPPMAKDNLQARDDDLFPLMDKVQEFLASDRQVMLILGDSGAGKSTFNTHLELALLQSYTRGARIPLFINLPAIDRPDKELIIEQLKTYNFSEAQIQELKQRHRFVVICDGYDEGRLTINLHTSNLFNRSDQWDVKLVISCRSQYLGQDYRDYFVPQGVGHYNRPSFDLFQEAAIAPFSKMQIQDYVEQYIPLEPRTWTTQDYMDKLTTIPNLIDLVKNPFLLSLSLEALLKVTEGKLNLSTIKITRVQLYDIFVGHWLDVNKRRLLRNILSKKDRAALNDILDTGFVSMGVDYSTRLALAIFDKQEGNPVVQYFPGKDKNSWKAKFFGPDPEIRLLRESSPLTRTGSMFQFLHRSMLEYFLSRAIFDPSGRVVSQEYPPHPDPDSSMAQSPDPRGPLFSRGFLTEPSILQFLCERTKKHPIFEKQLLDIIEQSKTDPTAATAAANAITILVRAGVRFNGADLRGIRIPGADLSGSQLDSAQLQDADLTNVTFAGSWLRKVDLSGARMNGVRFGELPFLEVNYAVSASAYSPDGKMLAIVDSGGSLSIFNIISWKRDYFDYVGDSWDGVVCFAFSPNNQQLVYGRRNKIRLWNVANNNIVLDMKGSAGSVQSVAFSPCGKQLASASKDKTIRLWSVETRECMFVLEGHTGGVAGVAYCADGKRLVSGSSDDGTIRVWDPETGETVTCWNISREKYSILALSADGRWVAVAVGSKIQVMNAVTGEPSSVLNNSGKHNRIAFSPNGQWIVIWSDDNTLRLWDLSSGLLISSFSGHAEPIYTCNISPSCSQIASGDGKGYVRLWEVDTSRGVLGLDRSASCVRTVTYSPDGRSILSYSDYQGVQQWDSRTGVSTSPPLKIYDNVSSSTFSPVGNQIATGHQDGTIRLRNRLADSAECTLLGHTQEVDQLAYSPCGRWIVSAVRDEVRLWDLYSNKHPGVIAKKAWRRYTRNTKSRVAFTPTGRIVLSLGDETLRLYDPRAEDPCTALKWISINFEILSLDCSAHGQMVAIGTNYRSIYLWNFQPDRPDKPGFQLQGLGGWVESVAFSPCGKWILAGTAKKTVRIWRFRTGEVSSWSCVADVGGFSGIVAHLDWNPVVAMEFVTGCEDGSVRVWRITSHDDANRGEVTVQMLWGNDVGLLCTSGLTFKGAIGLSPIKQKLLVQRGAIDGSPPSEGHEAHGKEAD